MNAYVLPEFVVSVLILVYIANQMSRLRCERFRCDIRDIRDNLFDFMHQHGYAFDDSEYVATRAHLNGLLRLSNRMSFFRLLLLLVFMGQLRFPEAEKPQRSRIPQLDEKLREANEAAAKRLVEHLGPITRILVGIIGGRKRRARGKEAALKHTRSVVESAHLFYSSF